MNVSQHLKVAQWHIEKARRHAEEEAYSCGCPINAEYEKIIDDFEKMTVEMSDGKKEE